MEWAHGIIPLIVPIVIAGVKALLPRVPVWVLPVLAPLLGAALDILSYYAGLVAASSPLLGAVLGGAGVAVREIQDQVRKTLVGSP